MPMHLRKTVLLATDQKNSVLNALDAARSSSLAYTPYGHRPAENGLLSLLGFNGERPDPVTGHYHLGNGYRQFNPVLMRFNSPDSWSPFGEGGLNAYGYCEGEPVLRVDRNGHAWGVLKALGRQLGLRSSAKKIIANSFNAGSKQAYASKFFRWEYDIKSKMPIGQPTQTASMIYVKKTNALYLHREVRYPNLAFTTEIRINSKGNPLAGEGLTSITANKDYQVSAPEDFYFITNLSEHLKRSKVPLGQKGLDNFLHPEEVRKIRRMEEFLSQPKSRSRHYVGGTSFF